MFSRTILFCAAVYCAVSLTGCAGPLRVTAGGYDPIRVNAEQRANVERANGAAAQAKKKSDETAAAIEPAEEKADAAEELDTTSARRARLQLAHARWRADEAEKAWLVALAEVELAKHIAAQGKGNEYEQLKRELEDQLFDLKNQHAAAAKSLAASTEDLKAAGATGEDNPY